MAGRRVVIVGVASHWGAELARRLALDPTIDYLAGIDIEPPTVDLERTDFIEADIRRPLLSRLLPSTEADTIVHCGILWYPEAGNRPGSSTTSTSSARSSSWPPASGPRPSSGSSSAGRRPSTAARGRRRTSSPRTWHGAAAPHPLPA